MCVVPWLDVKKHKEIKKFVLSLFLSLPPSPSSLPLSPSLPPASLSPSLSLSPSVDGGGGGRGGGGGGRVVRGAEDRDGVSFRIVRYTEESYAACVTLIDAPRLCNTTQTVCVVLQHHGITPRFSRLPGLVLKNVFVHWPCCGVELFACIRVCVRLCV